MGRVEPADWKPVGVSQLEPNAWNALRHEGSSFVVAGPGAGKTEFLAQRADYLFQTRACPPPHSILAISFKRDAARNLADRVRARTPDSIHRFDSLTFDAFTKGGGRPFPRCAARAVDNARRLPGELPTPTRDLLAP